MRTSVSVGRAALVDAALLLALVALWQLTAHDRSTALAPDATLVDLLVASAGLVVVVALGWLVVLSTLLVLEPLAGRRLTGWAGCPDGLRRLLLVVCGAATAAALAVPADAATHGPDPSPGAQPTRADRDTSALLDGLPMPERPLGVRTVRTSSAARPADATPRPAVGAVSRRVDDDGDQHTVRPGDTLWAVAAEQLGPDAGAAATARAWRLIYAANRDVVGTDPDLIQPGTNLRVPPTVQEDRP